MNRLLWALLLCPALYAQECPTPLAEEIAYSNDPTPLNYGSRTWKDVPNAFDGDVNTYAHVTHGPGHLFEHNIEGNQHSISVDFRSIVNIYGRVYQHCFRCAGTHEFESGEFGWYMPPSHAAGWTEETWIPEIFGGWNSYYHQLWDNHHTKDSGDVELRVYRTQYRVVYHPGLHGALYNFSNTDFLDEQNAWSIEAGVNYAPFSATRLAKNKNGSSTDNALVLLGTDAPSVGGDIKEVYLRFSGRRVHYDALHAEIWTAGKAELLRTESINTTRHDDYFNFGPWVRINPPAEGWSWDAVQNLEAYLYGTGYVSGNNYAQVGYVQLKVFTPQ